MVRRALQPLKIMSCRFQAAGWHTRQVDGHGVEDARAALSKPEKILVLRFCYVARILVGARRRQVLLPCTEALRVEAPVRFAISQVSVTVPAYCLA